MQHMIRAVVKYLDPKQALHELALCIDCVFHAILWYDIELLVQDTVAIHHALVDVSRLLDQLLQLYVLFAALIVHEHLLLFIDGLPVPGALPVRVDLICDVASEDFPGEVQHDRVAVAKVLHDVVVDALRDVLLEQTSLLLGGLVRRLLLAADARVLHHARRCRH